MANILGAIFFGIDNTVFFYSQTLPSLIHGEKVDYYNQSLVGFLAREVQDLYTKNLLKILLSAVLVLFSLGVLSKKLKKNIYSEGIVISLLMTLVLLVSSVSWQHHFVWLIFPLFATFFYLKHYKLRKIYFLILAVIYILVAFNFRNPEDIPLLLQSHVFFGALILWGLNFYILFKLNPKLKKWPPRL